MMTMDTYLKNKHRLQAIQQRKGIPTVADIVRKKHITSGHKLVYYNNITVLKTLSAYNIKHKDKIALNLNKLMHMRYTHGTQFLIDLFIMSEVHIKHIVYIDIKSLRKDIVHILNQIPEYRIKYETN